jgi:hypothetical protein
MHAHSGGARAGGKKAEPEAVAGCSHASMSWLTRGTMLMTFAEVLSSSSISPPVAGCSCSKVPPPSTVAAWSCSGHSTGLAAAQST